MSACISRKPKDSDPEERLSIIKQSSASVAIMTACYVFGYHIIPFPVPVLSSPAARVLYSLQWQVVSAYLLLAGIATVALTRFLTPAINPFRPDNGQLIAVHVRYVQNTLEQFVLSALGQLAISVYLTGRQMKLIPILIFLFVVGRITFWIGYARSYLQRSFGMTLTVLPTFIVYLLLFYYFLMEGPMSFLWSGESSVWSTICARSSER